MLFGLFGSKKEDPYMGLEDDPEKARKMLSDQNSVLARLKNLNNSLQAGDVRARQHTRDMQIAERLIKEGSGR